MAYQSPIDEASWKEHLFNVPILKDKDDTIWGYQGTWRLGHPVYVDQNDNKNMVFRDKNIWFYSKNGEFSGLAQAEHRDNLDPHLPPLGYGWIFCKDHSPVVGIQFALVEESEETFKKIQYLGDSESIYQMRVEVPQLLSSVSAQTILDAVRERMTPLFFTSTKQLFTLTPEIAAAAKDTVERHFLADMTSALPELAAPVEAILPTSEAMAAVEPQSTDGEAENAETPLAGDTELSPNAEVTRVDSHDPHLQNSFFSMLKHRKLSSMSTGSGNISSVLAELQVVANVLRDKCDAPYELVKWDGSWHAKRGAVVQRWLASTIVAGAEAASGVALAAEAAMVKESEELQARFKETAHALQKEDMQIYTSAINKAAKKDLATWTALTNLAKVDAERVKAQYPKRPVQPGLDRPGTTILDLKHQASLAYMPFFLFSRTLGKVLVETLEDNSEWRDVGVVDDLKAYDIKVSMAKKLKKSERILQKIFLRGTVASICDVVRALISVPDLDTMRVVHEYLFACETIVIVDFKDRLNNPTAGGWADLVYLVTLKGGDGHICELQLALQPMLTAREGMRGHDAYNEARHLLEVLNYLKIDCTPDDSDADAVRAENDKLKLALSQKDAEIAELQQKISQLTRAQSSGVESRGRHKWTSLILAAVHGDEILVGELLESGADVTAVSDKGNTALICAAVNGYGAVVEKLLDSGADINAQNIDGYSALMYAAHEGWSHIVKLLLQRGASISMKTETGKTAADLAAGDVLSDVVLMLQLQDTKDEELELEDDLDDPEAVEEQQS